MFDKGIINKTENDHSLVRSTLVFQTLASANQGSRSFSSGCWLNYCVRILSLWVSEMLTGNMSNTSGTDKVGLLR